MPPSKVKIERIVGDRTRQNTFHKRKLGLIKKAIELTVLCDCECAIILRSGPTVMCQDGRLSAYCNKDLEKMLKDCLAEMPMEYYTNDEYTRLSKDGESVVEQPSSQESQQPLSQPSSRRPSEHKIEVDIEAGTHSVPLLQPGGDKAQELRQRMASMEAELKALQQTLGPDSGGNVLRVEVGNQELAGYWPTPEKPSPQQSSSPGGAKVRKRAPPLSSFTAMQLAWPQQHQHQHQHQEQQMQHQQLQQQPPQQEGEVHGICVSGWDGGERESKRACLAFVQQQHQHQHHGVRGAQLSVEASAAGLHELYQALPPPLSHYPPPAKHSHLPASRPAAPVGPSSASSLASGFFAPPHQDEPPPQPAEEEAEGGYGGAELPALSPSAATWDLSHIFPASPAHLALAGPAGLSPSHHLKREASASPLLGLHTPGSAPPCPLLPFQRGTGAGGM